MAPILAFMLFVRAAMFPNMIPVQLGAYETMRECREAAIEFDKSIDTIVILDCEVRI